jgi:hypothetical protein
MAVLMIGGAAMPAPSELSVSVADIGDDAGRNILGARVVDRVAVKRTVEIDWAYLTSAQLSVLMAAVEPVFFTARYPDPVDGGVREATFRAAEKHARVFRADGAAPAWAEVAMKWEEK